MILGPRSEPFSRKTTNNFHRAKTESESTRLRRGDSIIKCGSCTYSSGKLGKKSKKVFIYLKKEKEKKHSRQCTRGPAMRVVQSGRCRDQA